MAEPNSTTGNDNARQWRTCHKDPQVNLILSVHDQIESQTIEVQKMLYPSWIDRTNNHFKDTRESDIPTDVKAWLMKAKAVLDGESVSNDESVGGIQN